MWRTGRQYAYSQNSIRSPQLVKRLLNKSRISSSDIVIEIGAGKGIITRELARKSKQVIALEIDPELYKKLTYTFKDSKNVRILNKNFLKYSLPKHVYKVFSNIPFNFTSRIISKLLKTENAPLLAYLIIQEEAAKKLMGSPRETQMSLLLKPLYSMKLSDRLKRSDFEPRPRVKTVFIEIEKLSTPFVEKKNYPEYRDFVVCVTTQWKPTLRKSLKKVFTYEQLKRLSSQVQFNIDDAPLDLYFEQWLDLYKYYRSSVIDCKKILVAGSYFRQECRNKRQKKFYRFCERLNDVVYTTKGSQV